MELSIGDAAARFGLAPSTLRWWERQGLLTPAGRASGRRRYGMAELRTIALIKMWQDTGMMSLDDIGAILAGPGWRAIVQDRLAAIEEQAKRIETARHYLDHMLSCTQEYPAATCPVLQEEITTYAGF